MGRAEGGLPLRAVCITWHDRSRLQEQALGTGCSSRLQEQATAGGSRNKLQQQAPAALVAQDLPAVPASSQWTVYSRVLSTGRSR